MKPSLACEFADIFLSFVILLNVPVNGMNVELKIKIPS